MLDLPVPGTMVNLTKSFAPAVLTGIKVNPANPLEFDFLIQPGDKALTATQKQEEYLKLVKYFLAALTTPEKDMWVNLSPYEGNRIVPNDFGGTEVGRDLLAEDYILKQLTASLIHPQKELGKKFWDSVYSRTKEQFGTTQVPVNTFNKVWIIPQSATVYENGHTAMVVKSHLKVMLEEDYLALEKNQTPTRGHLPAGQVSPGTLPTSQGLIPKAPQGNNPNAAPNINSVGTQVLREVIIPAIEQEVNEGSNFAQLRQIYNAVILSAWFKKRLKESILGKIYVDRAKTNGIALNDPTQNQKIFDQYVKAYKKGVYNFIKEDTDPTTQQVVPRKYFSGGVTLLSMAKKVLSVVVVTAAIFSAQAQKSYANPADTIRVGLGPSNAASQVAAAPAKAATAAKLNAAMTAPDAAMLFSNLEQTQATLNVVNKILAQLKDGVSRRIKDGSGTVIDLPDQGRTYGFAISPYYSFSDESEALTTMGFRWQHVLYPEFGIQFAKFEDTYYLYSTRQDLRLPDRPTAEERAHIAGVLEGLATDIEIDTQRLKREAEDSIKRGGNDAAMITPRSKRAIFSVAVASALGLWLARAWFPSDGKFLRLERIAAAQERVNNEIFSANAQHPNWSLEESRKSTAQLDFLGLGLDLERANVNGNAAGIQHVRDLMDKRAEEHIADLEKYLKDGKFNSLSDQERRVEITKAEVLLRQWEANGVDEKWLKALKRVLGQMLDNAATVPTPTGGIDMNNQLGTITFEGQKVNFPIPQGFEYLLKEPISGFVPRIKEINTGTFNTLPFFSEIRDSQPAAALPVRQAGLAKAA